MPGKGLQQLPGLLRQVRSRWTDNKTAFTADQHKFVVEGCVSGCFNGLATGMFMTGYALWLGASESGAGLISSIPLLANVLQLLAVRMWSVIRDHKRAIRWYMLLARLLIGSIILIPLFIPHQSRVPVPVFGEIPAGIALLAALLLFSYILGAQAGMKQNIWLVNTVPRELRGSFFSYRDRFIIVLNTGLSLAASSMLDRFKGADLEYYGFAVIFGVTVILALADFKIQGGITYTESWEKTERMSARELLGKLLSQKGFLLVAIYLALWNFGSSMALPYYNVYMLKYLGISYTHIMFLMVLQILVHVLVIKYWGRFATQTSWIVIAAITSAMLGGQFIVWILINGNTVWLIPSVFIIAGVLSPGLNMAMFNLPYGYIPEKFKTVFLSVLTATNSVAGFLGVQAGGWIIERLKPVHTQIGFIELGSIQFNILISMLLIFCSVAFAMFRIPKEETETNKI